MRGLRKFLQILFSLFILLAVLAVASMIYPIPYVSDFVSKYVLANQIFIYVLVVLLALALVYFAVAFIWSIFAPSKFKTLKMDSEFGKIHIDRETVSRAIHRELLDVKQASNKQVEVKLGRKPENTKIKVDYSVDQNQPVQSISDQINQKAKAAAERVLATSVQDVKVSATTYDPSQSSQQNSGHGQARVR